MRKILWIILVIVGLCIACVAVSLLSNKPTNPPITAQPQWDSPRTLELAKRACFDCHSNETVWPWYTNLPPFSFLIKNDVYDGRRALNFSEWDRPQRGARPQSVDRRIQRGSMPPWHYMLMHSQAKLSDAEKQALMHGLDTTVAQNPPPPTKP